MNTFGKNLRLTTFGESHGIAMGGVIDGFPSGFKIDFENLYEEIAKRRPGSNLLVTQRNEDDMPEFLSGISPDGITLGTSIGFIIRNKDNRSRDYEELKDKYRPNHADYTYDYKYGIRDYRGGGRSSARETVNWVVAGALAAQWLKQQGITIESCLTAVGKVSVTNTVIENFIKIPSHLFSLNNISEKNRKKMEEEIHKAKENGDSVGGVVTCLIKELDPGVGEPIFRKLHAQLAHAMMTINGAKAFEYGVGAQAPLHTGIESLDIFSEELSSGKKIATKTNFSGGIQGGISNGMPIYFNVTLKPTPTVMREIETVDKEGHDTLLKMRGRHDPCIAVRAVPVVKWFTLNALE